LPQLVELAKETTRLKRPIKWVYVQISEAHADNEWPIGNAFNSQVPTCDQTCTTPDRVKAAVTLTKAFQLREGGFTICIDKPPTMADVERKKATKTEFELGTGPFERFFRPWPTSWFVFRQQPQSGKLIMDFQATPRNAIFEVESLTKYLGGGCTPTPLQH